MANRENRRIIANQLLDLGIPAKIPDLQKNGSQKKSGGNETSANAEGADAELEASTSKVEGGPEAVAASKMDESS